MRIPDWLVYAVVLVALVGGIFGEFGGEPEMGDPRRGSPGVEIIEIEPPPQPLPPDGPPLRDPDPLDEQVLVQVGEASNSIGTAFALNESGLWLTARHVVDGCSDVGIVVGGGRLSGVDRVVASRNSDLALLFTNRAPVALNLDIDRRLRLGEAGFHVGFPQGEEGEASSQLLSRSRLITRGRYELEESVLAWAEQERVPDFPTLSGMSGGPVLDAGGSVVGVTVAESSRRGRIYTASPESIIDFLDRAGVQPQPGVARPISSSSYGGEADRLRDEFAVVQVVCRVRR